MRPRVSETSIVAAVKRLGPRRIVKVIVRSRHRRRRCRALLQARNLRSERLWQAAGRTSVPRRQWRLRAYRRLRLQLTARGYVAGQFSMTCPNHVDGLDVAPPCGPRSDVRSCSATSLASARRRVAPPTRAATRATVPQSRAQLENAHDVRWAALPRSEARLSLIHI